MSHVSAQFLAQTGTPLHASTVFSLIIYYIHAIRVITTVLMELYCPMLPSLVSFLDPVSESLLQSKS